MSLTFSLTAILPSSVRHVNDGGIVQVSTGNAEANTLDLARVFVGDEQWQHVKGSRKAQRAQKVKTAAADFEAKSREIHLALTSSFPLRITLDRLSSQGRYFKEAEVTADSSIFTSREWFGDWIASCMKLHETPRPLTQYSFKFEITGGELSGKQFRRPFVWSRSGEPFAVTSDNVLRAYAIPAFSNSLYFDLFEGFDKLTPSVLRSGPYGRLPKELWDGSLLNGSLMAKARVYHKTLPTIKKFTSKAVDGEASHLEALAAHINVSTRSPVNDYKDKAVCSADRAFVCGLARETVEHENFFSVLNCVTESLPSRRSAEPEVARPAPQTRAKNRDNCLRRLKRKLKSAGEPALAYTLGIFGAKAAPRPVRDALCSRFSGEKRPKNRILEEYRRRSFQPLGTSRFVAIAKQDPEVPTVLLQRVMRRFRTYAEATAPSGARAPSPTPG